MMDNTILSLPDMMRQSDYNMLLYSVLAYAEGGGGC